MSAQKFCHICGAAFRMRYPGNDPENGPAEMRCPTGLHFTIAEEAATADPGDDTTEPSDTARLLVEAIQHDIPHWVLAEAAGVTAAELSAMVNDKPGAPVLTKSARAAVLSHLRDAGWRPG